MYYKKIKLLLTILLMISCSSLWAQNNLSKDTGYTKVFQNSAGCSGFNLGEGTVQNNATACAAKCDQSNDCHGFSYNPINKGCRLKVNSFCMKQGDDELGYTYYTRNAKYSDNVDLEVEIFKYGYERVADGDCLESDLSKDALAAEDLTVCAGTCQRAPGCKGFSYSHTDKKCILKSMNDINSCSAIARVRGNYQFYGKIK